MSTPKERQAARDVEAARLAAEYAHHLPESVTAAVFQVAWEYGHASGSHEVEINYDQLAALAYRAYRAGKESRP